ncbi:hypothetical protein Vadar_022735 [Vaccinium darrowii]|uniref:Uncharacterized protein n=1 Tax=Vaccinium darrowii TaxID=229202 RepID=A0ACB7Z721_9ERIC|nr:hypothetical protein Vadar_022735 [Vaccinium darrowii]
MAFRTTKLVFYRGGYVSKEPNKAYVCGNVSPISDDPDLLSFFEMKALIKELRGPEYCEVYHKSPSQTMDDGLFCLIGDKVIVDMVKMHGDVIDLYVHDPSLVPKKHTLDNRLTLDNYVVDEGLIPAGPVEGNGPIQVSGKDDDEDEESKEEWESGDYTDDSDFSGFEESSEDDEEEEELNHPLRLSMRKVNLVIKVMTYNV